MKKYTEKQYLALAKINFENQQRFKHRVAKAIGISFAILLFILLCWIKASTYERYHRNQLNELSNDIKELGVNYTSGYEHLIERQYSHMKFGWIAFALNCAYLIYIIRIPKRGQEL